MPPFNDHSPAKEDEQFTKQESLIFKENLFLAADVGVDAREWGGEHSVAVEWIAYVKKSSHYL